MKYDNRNISVCIITHASHEYGIGHLSRSRIVLEQFQELGISSHIHEFTGTATFTSCLLETAESNVFTIVDFDPRFWMKETLLIKHFFAENFNNKKILIFDTPDFLIRNNLEVSYARVFYINPYLAHSSTSDNNCFTGLCFFPFSARARTIRKKEIDYSLNNNIVIACGGSDPHRVSQLYLRLLNELSTEPLQIYISIGPLFSINYTKEIQSQAALSQHQVTLFKHEDFESQVFVNAEIVLTSGGLTRYELAYCGVPFFTLNFDLGQEATSKFFCENGASFHLGHIDDDFFTLSTQFRTKMAELHQNASNISQFSRFGRRIFDEVKLLAAQELLELGRL